MKKVLALAALAEMSTGLLLLACPTIVVHLLFGVEISGISIVLSRFGGICLVGLSLACWPGNDTRWSFYGMLTYSTLVMLYLANIGVRGESVGSLLWPAVVAHAILGILLVGARYRERRIPTA